MKTKILFYFTLSVIVFLVNNCSTTSKQFVQAYSESLAINSIEPLELYNEVNKNSEYSNIVDSIISIKTAIDKFNEEVKSFTRENKFSENGLHYLKELIDRYQTLDGGIKNINDKIDFLDLEQELKKVYYRYGNYDFCMINILN